MKNTFTLCIILVLGLSFCQTAFAQDPRFAQFYAAPLQLNPAMTGVFEGQFRMAANYRELYSSVLGNQPFRTIAASFDTRHEVSRGNYFGFGAQLLSDAAGLSNFTRQTGNIGASFMKQLNGGRYASNEQYLIAGAQIGAGQQSLNWNKLWFSSQYDEANAAIRFDDPNGEGFLQNTSNVYADFNAGVLWYALFDDNQSIYFGGAIHHLNTPNVSFLEQSNPLPWRWVAHGGGEIPFTRQLSILPAVAIMGQNKAMSTTAGANFRYTNREWRELALRAGAWGHVVNRLDSGVTFDALTFTAILEMERWNLGFSYDVTMSNLALANNGRGAFEVSLMYIQPAKTRVRMSCPNF